MHANPLKNCTSLQSDKVTGCINVIQSTWICHVIDSKNISPGIAAIAKVFKFELVLSNNLFILKPCVFGACGFLKYKYFSQIYSNQFWVCFHWILCLEFGNYFWDGFELNNLKHGNFDNSKDFFHLVNRYIIHNANTTTHCYFIVKCHPLLSINDEKWQ